MRSNILKLLVIAFLSLTPVIGLTACGGGGGGSSASNDNNSAGSHYAGQNCISSGCHDGGFEVDKRFSYAGTVYSGATGRAESGKNVTITDSTGRISLSTDASGNFYTTMGNPGGSYNSAITIGMVATQTDGSCNNSGCHDAARRLY